jgi:hypothetical protein
VPDDSSHSPAADVLVDIMRLHQTKDPALAAKQTRLLAVLAESAADGLNRAETEVDGLRAGARRLMKAQRQAEALRGQAGVRGGNSGEEND